MPSTICLRLKEGFISDCSTKNKGIIQPNTNICTKFNQVIYTFLPVCQIYGPLFKLSFRYFVDKLILILNAGDRKGEQLNQKLWTFAVIKYLYRVRRNHRYFSPHKMYVCMVFTVKVYIFFLSYPFSVTVLHGHVPEKS